MTFWTYHIFGFLGKQKKKKKSKTKPNDICYCVQPFSACGWRGSAWARGTWLRLLCTLEWWPRRLAFLHPLKERKTEREIKGERKGGRKRETGGDCQKLRAPLGLSRSHKLSYKVDGSFANSRHQKESGGNLQHICEQRHCCYMKLSCFFFLSFDPLRNCA